MKKSLKIYLTESLYNKAKQLSAAKGMSMSTYICSCLAKSASEETVAPAADYSEADSCSVRLHGTAAEALRRKADNLGLSPTVFIRDVILNKDLNIITIDRASEKELVEIFREYEAEIKTILLDLSQRTAPESYEIIEKSINDNLKRLGKVFERYCDKTSRSKESQLKAVKRIINGN